jgi:hypothetical protein
MCCRKNSLLVTEEDKTHILNLYGLLNEATSESQGILSITADTTFEAGYYTNLGTEGQQELQDGLAKAQKWMTENKDSLISVQIQAGESQITNFDQEQRPAKWVKPYVLSELRAKTLKRLLIPYFEGLVSKGVLSKMPIFENPLITIGKTPYTQGVTTITPALRTKYDNEQFVRVVMKLIQPGKCAVGLEVEVSYNKTPNSKFPCRGGHKCDVAKFQVLVNNVPIGTADLNNGKDGGTRTSGVLTVKPDMADAIAKFSKDSLTVSLKCLSGARCHSGTPEVKISKKGTEGQPATVLYHSCSPAIARGDQNQYDILKMDACGNVVQKGTGDASNKDATEPPSATGTTQPAGYTLPTLDLLDENGKVCDTVDKWFSQVFKYPSNSPKIKVTGPTYVNNQNKSVVSFERGFNKERTEWNGSFEILPDAQLSYPFKIGTAVSGADAKTDYKFGIRPGSMYVFNLEGGMKISRITADRSRATNLPPEWMDKLLLGLDSTSSGGQFHVASKNRNMGDIYTLPGKSKATQDAETEKDKSNKETESKRIERDNGLKVKTFKMDDQDKIEDFEEYFKDYIKKRDDLNLGGAKDYYEVTAEKMTYAGNVYNKGQIIRLTE